MTYRRSLISLLKCGAVGGIVASGVSLYLPEPNKHFRKVSERFSVAAKSKDVDPSRSDLLNNVYQGQERGAKWDNNWDCRYCLVVSSEKISLLMLASLCLETPPPW